MMMLERYRRKKEWELARIRVSVEKKEQAYIKKKELEYKRKMLNEIRQMQGKEPKEYKTKSKLNPLNFALALAQENARLRDTNENWYWKCISCDKLCSWSELAGGHRYSRQILNVCLEKVNINAQCHTCNFKTWPMWKPLVKQEVNAHYDENIIKKRWQEKVDELRVLVHKWFQTSGEYRKRVRGNLNKIVPELINENERLRKTKTFYKPAKKWREKRELFVRMNPQYKYEWYDNFHNTVRENHIEKGEKELQEQYWDVLDTLTRVK